MGVSGDSLDNYPADRVEPRLRSDVRGDERVVGPGADLGAEVGATEGGARYLKVLGAALLLYLVLVVPFNLLVDAHSTFPASHLQAFASGRPTESRISKANAAAHAPAEIVVVGSSRAIGAFNAGQPALAGRTYLNLAVQDTSLPELTKITRFAVEHDAPRELIIGADFEVFHYEHIPDEFLKARFNPPVHPSEIILEQALSVYAAEQSLKTWKASMRHGDEDGTAVLSRLAKFQILLSDAIRLAIEVPPKPHVAPAQLASLRQVILDAQKRGANVNVVIMPVHATILWVLDRAGLWTRFEDWKRDMVALLANTPARLWDFNGFDEPQWEAIPAESDSDQDMVWFTDASHCSPHYGDRILNRVLNRSERDSLGVLLTPETIEPRLEAVRRQKQQFSAARAPQLRLVSQIFAQDRERRRALQN